jgi:homoserine O-succinyltransferase
MPILVKPNSPRWIQKDAFSITQDEANKQDIRPLRIGLVNYMPDKAFVATEQDFITPLIEAAGVLQFEVILFAPQSVPRDKETQTYIDAHQEKISEERLRDCDIFIQSGFNDVYEDGSALDFENGEIAKEVLKNFDLAKKAGVTTQVASCSASQVIALNKYGVGVRRVKDEKKLIGVFPHQVFEKEEENFVTRNLNSEFGVVFARNHKLNTEEIIHHETLKPLILSKEVIDEQKETHLFYDPKELFFGFQGHPEYQKFAILKEYLRDIGVFYRDAKNVAFPEIPPNYLTPKGFEQMKVFTEKVKVAAQKRLEFAGKNPSEEELEHFDQKNRPQIDESIYDEVLQSWKDTGDKVWARIFNATYQLTGFEPGQKLTTKRDIAMQEFPLEALK